MKRIIRANFFTKIVLPAMLAIILFMISVFAFVIPTFERNAVEQKKLMLQELTNTAWSILDKYSVDAAEGLIGITEAHNKAVAEIQALRYGHEDKDYFWITDLVPVMIMHPYVQELTGQSLQNFTDPDGKKLFIEAAEIARSQGSGFIRYKWQLRDDSTRIVPKLSFVKHFTPWDWVIGTGIYMDDVQDELSSLTRKLLLILLGITLIIALIIFFITYQSLTIENSRLTAEEKLRESHEKYRSLLESSTEGIILLLNTQIAYANTHIQNLLNYSADDLASMPVTGIIPGVSSDELFRVTAEKRLETKLLRKDGGITEALLTILPVKFADKEGLLLTFRDISEHRSLKTEVEELRERLKNVSDIPPDMANRFAAWVSSVAITRNTTAAELSSPVITCPADTPVITAAEIISRNQSMPVLLLVNSLPAGIITTGDIVRRVVAPGADLSSPAMIYMSSPVISAEPGISVAEAASIMRKKGISHLLLKDAGGHPSGILSRDALAGLLADSAEVATAGILKAVTVNELALLRKRLPWLVRPLLRELGDVSTFTTILSQFNDAITIRLIEMAVEEAGPPPAPFTFIVYGSAGREELTFNSDQDNAIIYHDESTLSPEDTHAYFMRLAEKVCRTLHDTGLVRCRGGYMASNPKWCQPLSVWKGYFSEWILNAEPENLLNFSVFFDLRSVYGESRIFEELEDFIFGNIKGRTAFFYFLAQSVAMVKVPSIITIAGNEETGKKKEEVIDIKAATAPMVMFTRIFALNHGMRIRNTAARINALRAAGALSRQTCDELASNHNFLVYHRMQSQLRQLTAREEITAEIPLSRMIEMEQIILKRILSHAGNFNEILAAEFMSSVRG